MRNPKTYLDQRGAVVAVISVRGVQLRLDQPLFAVPFIADGPLGRWEPFFHNELFYEKKNIPACLRAAFSKYAQSARNLGPSHSRL